jgi:hypothetical protein
MLKAAVIMRAEQNNKGPRMLTKLTVIAALTCVAMPAFASNWITVDGAPGDPQVTDIDTTSITRNGHIVSVWERATLATPRMLAGTDAQPTSVVKIHTRFDCANRMQSTSSMTKYSTTGDAIGTNTGNGGFEDVIPDSVGDSIMRAICKPK